MKVLKRSVSIKLLTLVYILVDLYDKYTISFLFQFYEVKTLTHRQKCLECAPVPRGNPNGRFDKLTLRILSKKLNLTFKNEI
jgi:hypothetical protein